MYKRIDDPLNRSILNLVSEEEGIQLCELAQRLGANRSTVGYRLSILERNGMVKVLRKKQFLAAFPAGN